MLLLNGACVPIKKMRYRWEYNNLFQIQSYTLKMKNIQFRKDKWDGNSQKKESEIGAISTNEAKEVSKVFIREATGLKLQVFLALTSKEQTSSGN